MNRTIVGAAGGIAKKHLFVAALVAVSALGTSQTARSAPAQGEREGTCANAATLFPDTNPGPGSLKRIAVPEPTDLAVYVRDRAAAIVLGKALFWDMQVGSDGIVACATCHFRAGADPRSINQLNPGGQDNPRQIVDLGINRWLRPADFPLRQLADPADRRSAVLRDSDDVVSSAGVKLSRFVGVRPGADQDIVQAVADPVFNLAGLNTRRVEPRNTPTVINAAYNRRQFWDARASNLFNGVSPFGAGDADARVLIAGLQWKNPADQDPHRQCRPRVAGSGPSAQRSRDGFARSQVPRHRQAARNSAATAQAARCGGRQCPWATRPHRSSRAP